MKNILVEDHVRGVVKDLLRTRGISKTGGLVPDIHGTMKIPYKGLKNRLSIQVGILILLKICAVNRIELYWHSQ